MQKVKHIDQLKKFFDDSCDDEEEFEDEQSTLEYDLKMQSLQTESVNLIDFMSSTCDKISSKHEDNPLIIDLGSHGWGFVIFDKKEIIQNCLSESIFCLYSYT